MNFEEKLANVVNRYEEVQALLSTNISSDELVKLNKELSVLEPVVGAIENYKKHTQSMQDDKAMMEDASLDKEMREMAEAEYYEIKEQLPEMEKEIRVLLLPKEADDEKNAILEVRAGTGGDEAALFAAVLFEMYQRYSQKQGWKFEILDANENGLGGYKEASAKITGKDVFAKLKFESGAHRRNRAQRTQRQHDSLHFRSSVVQIRSASQNKGPFSSSAAAVPVAMTSALEQIQILAEIVDAIARDFRAQAKNTIGHHVVHATVGCAIVKAHSRRDLGYGRARMRVEMADDALNVSATCALLRTVFLHFVPELENSLKRPAAALARLTNGRQEERDPRQKPATLPRVRQRRIIGLAMPLQIIRNVKARLRQVAFRDQVERNQKPPNATISVQKRMDRLELVVRNGRADQVRHLNLVIVPEELQVAQQAREIFDRRRNEPSRREARAANPVLRRANLARHLVAAANAVQQPRMGLLQQTHGERQFGEFGNRLVHRPHVVVDLTPVIAPLTCDGLRRKNRLVHFRLRTLNTAGRARFAHDVHADEEANVRHKP